MGKGLSPLQKQILAVLKSGNLDDDFSPGEIMQALSLPPIASNRAAISKSLARLRERGLVKVGYCRYVCGRRHPGNSGFYVTA